jgi:drug/metabolite transporter (DMT)-like permease
LLDLSGWHAGAATIFAIVGLFYPGVVTVLTNESNRLLGPTLTGTLSSTAPLFATAFAVLVLGEQLTLSIAAGGVTIVAALILMSWRTTSSARMDWRLALPLSGALLRGLAQVLSKVGLLLWPSAYAATLISYTVSGAAIWGGAAVLAGRIPPQRSQRIAIPWFMAAGVLNGCAVLLLYQALHIGSVAVVAPLVALYPLFTLLFSAAVLKIEVLTKRTLLGVIIAVTGVALLVSN